MLDGYLYRLALNISQYLTSKIKNRMRQLPTLTVTLLLFSALVVSAQAREKSSVVFNSPCTCQGNHGVARWAAKTDQEKPPLNIFAIQRITPADICAWQGLGERPQGAQRAPAEQKWYAVEGRILTVKAKLPIWLASSTLVLLTA